METIKCKILVKIIFFKNIKNIFSLHTKFIRFIRVTGISHLQHIILNGFGLIIEDLSSHCIFSFF